MTRPAREDLGPLLARLLAETADNTAAVLTTLDLQARILAHLEGRTEDQVIADVSELLKARRREVLRELDQWTDSIERAKSGLSDA